MNNHGMSCEAKFNSCELFAWEITVELELGGWDDSVGGLRGSWKGASRSFGLSGVFRISFERETGRVVSVRSDSVRLFGFTIFRDDADFPDIRIFSSLILASGFTYLAFVRQP